MGQQGQALRRWAGHPRPREGEPWPCRARGGLGGMWGPGDGNCSAQKCRRGTNRGVGGQESRRVPLACAMACLGSCMPRPSHGQAHVAWPGEPLRAGFTPPATCSCSASVLPPA